MHSSTTTTSFKALWQTSLASVRANLLPGLILWCIGLGVALLYYRVDAARGAFTQIMEIRERYGYVYSGVATGLFGGLIPFLYLWWAKLVPRGRIGSWGAFFVFYWALRGVEVDLFYRLQAWLFGNALTWQTIVSKVLVDQFVYCVFWSAPFTAISYAWKDADFSWRGLRSRLGPRMFLHEIPSVLLSIWIVWIPATAIIYSLPLPLQIPLFNLVLCFFVLLVSMLSPENRSPRPERAMP